MAQRKTARSRRGTSCQSVGMFDAVVFDFDGLILDTETPLYDAWRLTYEHYGVAPIPIDEWGRSLGRADDDPLILDPLERLAGARNRDESDAEIQVRRRAHRDALLADTDVQAGFIALLDEADELDIAIALASSSPLDWIEQHLGPRDLLHRFAAVSCAGDGLPGKPAPAVYLAACAAVDADPTRSLALEDSPNGVAAAKAAGMRCIAVPTTFGRTLDFSHADAVVWSLSDVALRSADGLAPAPSRAVRREAR